MWNIQLQTTALNHWLDQMEQCLTKATDALSVIETEKEQIDRIWKSGAGEIWKAELCLYLTKAGDQAGEMKKIIIEAGEAGKQLADLESSIIKAAGKL